MSVGWQDYVTKLVATGKVSKAAIHGFAGDKWASTNGLELSPIAITVILDGINKPDTVLGQGIDVGGTKYYVLRAGDDTLYAKQGTSGFSVYKSLQAIIVGFYDPPIQPGACNNEIQKVGEYLKKHGR